MLDAGWLATNHHQAAYRAWACDEVLLLLLSLLLFGCIIYLFNSKISASTTATFFLAFCCLPLYDAADDDDSCGGAVVASAAAAVAPRRRPNVSYIHTILYGAEITYYTRHEAGFRCLHPLGLEVFFPFLLLSLVLSHPSVIPDPLCPCLYSRGDDDAGQY